MSSYISSVVGQTVTRNLACLAGMLVLVGPAWSQDSTDAAEPPLGPQPSLWVEPRVSAEIRLSDNGNLSYLTPQSEQLLRVSAGLKAAVNRPQVRGVIDYALSGLFFAQGTSSNELRHALNTEATLGLGGDGRIFLDVDGVIDDRNISAFQTVQGQLVSDVNRSQVSRIRLSPYFVGSLGGVADYELRFSTQHERPDTSARSDVRAQEYSFRVGRPPEGQRLGWSLNGYAQDVDYSLSQSHRFRRVTGLLSYAVSPELLLGASLGTESNDVLSAGSESYQNYGLSVDWRPSPRTRMLVSAEDRYFGAAHFAELEYRAARTVWRISSSRGSSTDSPLDAATSSLGQLSDLVNAYYAQLEADPVRRAALVEAELVRMGLPGDLQVFPEFLTSSALLETRQELSVAYFGVRDVLSLSIGQVQYKRLGTAISIGDDFDRNTRIDQRGWTLAYTHRLTPVTSYNLSYGQQRSVGTSASAKASLKTFIVGLNTRLAIRTSASLQLRRAWFQGAVTPYNETAISAVVTHRF